MYEQLLPCDHCGGMPQVGRSVMSADITSSPPRQPSKAVRMRDQERVRIYCGSCGMGTEWDLVENLDELSSLNRCAAVWNKRINRTPTKTGSLEELIDKEVAPLDSHYLLSLIANNTGEWPERGPVFARLALRISDAIATSRDFWPVTPVLNDAARYRKLMQQVRFVYVDGLPLPNFPTVPANPDLNDLAFEIRVADAVDNLPDRDRW
jgi:Restriction alleviation protein Lar